MWKRRVRIVKIAMERYISALSVVAHSCESLSLSLSLSLLVSSRLRHRYTLCDPIASSCPTVAQVRHITRHARDIMISG